MKLSDPRAIVAIILALCVLIPITLSSISNITELELHLPEFVYSAWKEVMIAIIALLAAFISSNSSDK